jgi:hypothetical protein
VSDVSGSRVHLLRQIPGREIPDELLRLLDVGYAVLPGGGGEADDRRLVAEAVEKAVRREVDELPLLSRDEIQPIGRGATMALNGSCFRPWPFFGS